MAGLCDTCKNRCKQPDNVNVAVCPDYTAGKNKKSETGE